MIRRLGYDAHSIQLGPFFTVSRFLQVVAVGALALLVLGPVGTMAFRSLRVDYVETSTGRRFEGQIRDHKEQGTVIRARGEPTSRLVPKESIVAEGRAFSVQHYARLFTGRGESGMLLATLALAGLATLLAFLLGLPAGLLVAATDIPGRRWLEAFLPLPLVLPPVLLAIALYRDLLAVEPEFLRAVAVFGLSLFPLVALFTARAVRAAGPDVLAAARLQTTPRDALLRVALGPALPGALAGALLVFCFVVADFAVPDFLGVTTAKNTIRVYANEVFTRWKNDGDAAAAAAAGMIPMLLAIAAFAAVLAVERKRETRAVDTTGGTIDPVPLGRGRFLALAFLIGLLVVSVAWPVQRHLETAGGAHFGQPVFLGGAAPAGAGELSRAKPQSLGEGLRRGLRHERVLGSTGLSLGFSAAAALLAVLVALVLTEAGHASPALDRALLLLAFLPVAVPPMSLAVGAVECYGPARAAAWWFPIPLLGTRLLPFATLAVRATRRRLAPELADAAAMAGLSPLRRFAFVTVPLVAPGALLGFLLAFLFGLREVDALVFTKSGAETLPVQLYNMIHYGFDVQVAALSVFWTLGVALVLGLAAFLGGRRFSLLP